MKRSHLGLWKHKSWLAACLLMVIGFILLGCAGGGPSYSSQAPAGPTAVQLLLDSGFKKIYPTTPAQKAGL